MLTLCDDQLETLDTTEVHWSTGTILAVFFAASLISAVFFGLGYSFGGAGNSKSAIAVASAATAVQPASLGTERTAAPSSSAVAVPQAVPGISQTSDSVRHAAVALLPVSVKSSVKHPAAVSAVRRAATPAASARHTIAVASRANDSRFMVQVGAIGDRKDADRLVSQLKKKGYYAGIYRGKHDKFFARADWAV
ncbi:MAG: SPOR domain-containing protein [Acidobacteriaceae bacterium]